MKTRRRRLGAWGFEGETYPPTPELEEWLEGRLGPSRPLPRRAELPWELPPARPLPELPSAISVDALDRIACARGLGLTDLLRLRAGALPALPDGVARPETAGEVAALLAKCARAGVRVIPRGGGTSVTGGVNVIPADQPTLVLHLERLAGLEHLDEVAGIAAFGAGTTGPAVERSLAAHGFTLGHFPQSWELSTLGGWIATRASGQESLGYGGIAEMISGLELVAPGERLRLADLPSSAAGPDLRQLVLGSEGRLGVITRATVRVRRRPEETQVEAFLMPSWEAGIEACRLLVQRRVPLTLLRLSDRPETEVALAVGLSHHPRLAALARAWLRLRGVASRGCLLLVGAAGEGRAPDRNLARARETLGRHGAVGLGRGAGRRWLAERFRHPYLRDELLDRGIAVDTLETAAPWSRLAELDRAVRRALEGALGRQGESTAVLCHLSHPYSDGASLYYTAFFRCPGDTGEAVSRWATLKRAATAALVAAGGTLSHHHGIGSWHAPWLEREIGAAGHRLLSSAARAMDPAGILNPQVLLDPTDRLEV